VSIRRDDCGRSTAIGIGIGFFVDIMSIIFCYLGDYFLYLSINLSELSLIRDLSCD